jgi:3-hydroxyisobutyrate dehydrogenase-like beta-hydroxyacid dehydrogenase
MALQLHRVALIGFGEAGGILGNDLAAMGRFQVATYDLLLDDPQRRAAMLAKAERARVIAAPTLAQAIEGADLIISAVTASAARDVARELAAAARPGQLCLEINSVSPKTRRENCRAIEQGGADYVEAAVMAPVPPQRLKVPILLGGRRAGELAECLTALGMNAKAVATDVGVASAIKMCRSIMIKGLEALTVECMFVARQYGAEEAVLKSLDATYPSMGWSGTLPDYLVSRVAEHGRRRAAEMLEVAQTLIDAEMEPTMAMATSTLQAWLPEAMAQAGLSYQPDAQFSWRDLVDALRRAREAEESAAPPASPK